MKNNSIINATLFLMIFGLLILGCKNAASENASTGKSTNETTATPKSTLTSPKAEPPLTSNEEKITRQKLGEDWVFTVDEGILACTDNEVIFKANGKIYAVNGAAKKNKTYTPVDEIWEANPKVEGLKKNIGAVIERGLLLCR